MQATLVSLRRIAFSHDEREKERLWGKQLFVNLMNGTILVCMHTICRHF